MDYVSRRDNDARTQVMQPGHRVEEYIERETALGGMDSLALYQHEYHQVDSDFSYQELTLAELGIPERDIVHVVADDKDYYLELKR